MGEVRVGVSGWKYASWRGDFYPQGLVQRRELEYVGSRMNAVEVNGSFYSLLRPSTYRSLVEERLVDVDTALANFLASGLLLLGRKLGPLLWQLPPGLSFDEKRVGDFLELLPRTTQEAARIARQHDDKLPENRAVTDSDVDLPIRHALEVRHPSFVTSDAVRFLARHDVALVVADSPGRWPYAEERTSDLMYVRLHGHTELYASGYSNASLDRWAEKVRRWANDGCDVHVYFDNDARGRAPHDAVSLLDRLA
jgi:uncharacterized protein YecE (DUF72 family)